MKDPVISGLVEQLKTKIEEANTIMSSLHEFDVTVQLSVGRETSIRPTLVSIISVIQTHDYS